MKTTRLILGLATLLIAGLADAHGEDKPGPNGGFIQMPGPFHTEVVPSADNKFKVFLLDMEWKNPTTTNSVVTAKFKSKDKSTVPANCKADGNYFACEFPKTVDLAKSGELLIDAKRERLKANTATYPLPLKLTAPGAGAGTHGGHSGH